MNVLEGKLVSNDIKVGIVCARFNEFITSKLLGGAQDALARHDVKDSDIDVAWVPGAFEIPLVAQKMANSGKYDAVICLGAVIRGSTSHSSGLLPNGLYAPDQGFFPKYTCGRYDLDGTTEIVSRGLGASVVPTRIFNRPNLVVCKLRTEP